jgi:PTS system mannose-specific IID component
MKLRSKTFMIAFLLSLGLIATDTATAHTAAPQELPRITLLTAILVGTLYYLAASPWLANLGFTVMYRPLIAGTLVGFIMGSPAEGIAIGANINILYLGWIGAGGNLPSDPALAGYLGTALALSGGLSAQEALALAAPLGLLGGLIYSVRMSACTLLAHRADRAAERATSAAWPRATTCTHNFFSISSTWCRSPSPRYLGAAVVAQALSWVTQNAAWVLSGLTTASGMLAALGIALNLKFLFQEKVWPYFLLGFMVTSLMDGTVNLLGFGLLAACLAYLHVQFTAQPVPAHGSEEAGAEKPPPGNLTRRDLLGAWLHWLFFSHAAYNWERMQGLGFAHSMTPIIRKRYTTPADIRAALQRHLGFFNTQPDVGGLIHGVVIAMEEERAAGAPISDEAINAIKTGLMGPLAGIGDTLQQGIVIPIGLAVAMNLATGGAPGTAARGNILGPLFFLLVGAAYVWGIGWTAWWQGYRQGRAAITGLLRSGKLR